MFATKDPRVKTTVAPLRIREDTAKYLRNLDPNSAVYDGKSRSMKENPNPSVPDEQQVFRGDNFTRLSGDYLNLMKQEGFTFDASTIGGVDLNNIAMPSQVEMAYKQFKEKKQKLMELKKKELIGKYGQGASVGLPEDVVENMKSQAEDLKEIVRSRVNAEERNLVEEQSKTKFKEDLHKFGHSSVWGSYWHPHFGWGYKCCLSFEKFKKCQGLEGKRENLKREYAWE